MNSEFSPDFMTLIDDDGKEHLFEILDVIENEDGCFYALLPRENLGSDDDSLLKDANYYIFEAIGNGEEQLLAEVEDSELIDRLAQTFEAHFEEMYEPDDEDNI